MKDIVYIAWYFVMILSAASAQIVKENVEYKQDDAELEGYLTYDKSLARPLPVVIVVHEWNGLNDYTKMRCDMLARMGYIAFGADIYGKGNRPKSMEEAGTLAGIYRNNIPLFRARVTAALDEVKKLKNADVRKIAAIGYCFGGAGVLELARSGADLQGVASFHGVLSTPNPDDAKNIKCKILILQGADDPYVKDDMVIKFENEMRQANVDWQLIKYSGAVHSFTNPNSGNDPSKGAAYNEKADKRSWAALTQFLDEIFSKK